LHSQILRTALALIVFGALAAAHTAGAQEPYLGEIRWVGFNFAPRGWALCNGQLLPISQNTALFSLLGTTYGGDGQTTFALPDLRGRVPIGMGQGPGLTDRELGETGGAEAVMLTEAELPSHPHQAMGTSNPAIASSPAGNVWGRTRRLTQLYGPDANLMSMSASAIEATGGDQPHENMPPFLTLTCIIALEGIFPSRP
jgi:microcystin-dependent protein